MSATPASATTSKSSFPAVANEKTRLLVLGSLPGEVSLKRSEYYAHPRNQFWRLMEAVIGVELTGSPYPARLATLLAAGVGLWDVIRSADRTGSLDANIRGHSPNALGQFTATLPSLRAIAFNGGKASEIGRKQLGVSDGHALITLPSSSPAHAIPFERKQAEWLRLRAFLDAAS
ncbi:DNA-deoxyinosine glycosylase [Phenylobacterium sp.]|uniref:DNA-deoxyinosine glycosylase n=1 Tax=Phenylobacterium sp. TaxID=1871053 RepID=UPI0035681A28